MNAPTKVAPQRVVAWIIDWILGFGVWIGMVMAVGEPFDVPGASAGFEFQTVNDATFVRFGESAWALQGAKFALVGLVALAWWLFNLVLLTGVVGASIGKLVTGIRVVRDDGRICGVGKAIIRWLLLIVDAFPYFLPLVGFIMVLATERNQRLGDMAAGTFVVRRAAVGTPLVLAGHGYAGYAPPPGPGYGPPPAPDAQWDAARGTWTRFDGQRWVGYDASIGGWRPL